MGGLGVVTLVTYDMYVVRLWLSARVIKLVRRHIHSGRHVTVVRTVKYIYVALLLNGEFVCRLFVSGQCAFC